MGWYFTESSSVPLLAAITTVHFPTRTGVVEVSLAALGKSSNVLHSWGRSGGSSGSMDDSSLLSLSGILCRLVIFIVPELSLVGPSLCLIGGGWHRDMAGPMINELLCQLLGTVKSGWS